MLKLAGALAGNPCCCSTECPSTNCINGSDHIYYDGANWWTDVALTTPAPSILGSYGFAYNWITTEPCGPKCMNLLSDITAFVTIDQFLGAQIDGSWDFFNAGNCMYQPNNYLSGAAPSWYLPCMLNTEELLFNGNSPPCKVPKQVLELNCGTYAITIQGLPIGCTPEEPCGYRLCWGVNVADPHVGGDCNPSYDCGYTLSWGTNDCDGGLNSGSNCCTLSNIAVEGPFGLIGACDASVVGTLTAMYAMSMPEEGFVYITTSVEETCCCQTSLQIDGCEGLAPSQFWIPGTALDDARAADAEVWLSNLPFRFTSSVTEAVIIHPTYCEVGPTWEHKINPWTPGGIALRGCYRVFSGIKEYYLDGTDEQIETFMEQVNNVRASEDADWLGVSGTVPWFDDFGAAGMMGQRDSNGQPFENLYGDKFCYKYAYTDTSLEDATNIQQPGMDSITPGIPYSWFSSFAFKSYGIAPDPLNAIIFELRVNHATLSAARTLITDPWPAWASGPVSVVLGRDLASFHATYGAAVKPAGTLANGQQCYRILSRLDALGFFTNNPALAVSISIDQWTTCGINAVPATIALAPGSIPA